MMKNDMEDSRMLKNNVEVSRTLKNNMKSLEYYGIIRKLLDTLLNKIKLTSRKILAFLDNSSLMNYSIHISRLFL